MAKCQQCGEDSDEITRVKVDRKTVRMCETCLEEHQEQEEIAAEAQGVMRGLMEYKG